MRRAASPEPAAAPTTPFWGAAGKVSRFASLSKEFDDHGLGQAASTLREVRAVPTIFCQVDQALGVGGWPTDRFGLIHGESNAGKSEFALGLIYSFLMRDHSGLLVDAERTTPLSWVRKLMGPAAEHPGFRVLYPESYEATVDAVRAWAEAIGEAKAKGRLDPETTGICVIDSLRKLAPKRLLERILKEDADGGDEDASKGGFGRRKSPRGIDGMGGRAAQFKAALNAQWVDELTPLLFQTGTCLVAIARETEASDSKGMTSFDNFDDFKVGGGRALYFESSVVVRVTKDGGVYDDTKLMIAERSRVQIRKTKIAGKLVRYPAANFSVATGADGRLYGFDVARDLVELGEQLGSVDVSGSHYSCGDVKLGQGREGAVRAMSKDPKLLAHVEAATRELFMPKEEVPPEAQAAPVPIARKGHRKAATKAAVKKGRKAAKKKGAKR